MNIVLPSLDIDPERLVLRAVRNSRPRFYGKVVRWACVGETFGLGSTASKELCRYFELDPDELLEGSPCPECLEREE